jgi:2-C-methyl-D-erythritol 4-phosphate cytidylyltransferase
MKAGMPKQFLMLRGKPVLSHTLELFLGLDGVTQVVLVIAEEYRAQFAGLGAGKLVFASPGKERQGSVFNGLEASNPAAPVVCIHDAARPLVTPAEIYQVIQDGLTHGAAVLGVPMKATVKESADGQFVLQTVDRSRLWEVQTPQVIRPALLREGFAKVNALNLAVTDDVSIIEQLGRPVKLTPGEYTNIKLTTPDDMQVAEQILRARESPPTGLRRLVRAVRSRLGL